MRSFSPVAGIHLVATLKLPKTFVLLIRFSPVAGIHLVATSASPAPTTDPSTFQSRCRDSFSCDPGC